MAVRIVVRGECCYFWWNSPHRSVVFAKYFYTKCEAATSLREGNKILSWNTGGVDFIYICIFWDWNYTTTQLHKIGHRKCFQKVSPRHSACNKICNMALFSVRYGFIPALVAKSSTRLFSHPNTNLATFYHLMTTDWVWVFQNHAVWAYTRTVHNVVWSKQRARMTNFGCVVPDSVKKYFLFFILFT